MTKQAGLGDNFYVGGYDLSGDTNSLGTIGGSIATIDVTGINKSAHERIGGLREGTISWVSYFDNASTAPFGAHAALSPLPRTDVGLMYMRGTALGSPAACMVGKQLNYDPSRTATGEITIKIDAQSNGFGLEWGRQLTAGIRTDTAATAGSPVDYGAATSLGFQAYLQVFGFTGTDATVTLQNSATSGGTYTNITSGSFAQITSGRQSQRIAVGGTANVLEFVKATTTTVGGFTSLQFAVMYVPNVVAVAF